MLRPREKIEGVMEVMQTENMDQDHVEVKPVNLQITDKWIFYVLHVDVIICFHVTVFHYSSCYLVNWVV